MNFRLTAILFGAVFLLAVVLLIQSFTGDEKPSTDALAEELAGVKAEEIDAVELEREGGAKIKLVRGGKDGKQWQVAEPYTARADSAAVNELVEQLLKAKPTAYSGMSSDPAAHGLAPAGLKVTLRAGERASTINLGDVTVGKGVVFVTTSARPKRPMAVSRSTIDAVFRESGGSGKAGDLAKTANDFRFKSVFPVDAAGADEVVGVTLKAKGKTLSLARSRTGWLFTSPEKWGEADAAGDVAASPGTFTGVRPLLGALTSLRAATAADFVENPTPQQLAEYGLADNSPDRIKVDLQTQDGQNTTAYLGKRDAAPPPAAMPHGMPQTGKVWVRVEGQQGAVHATAGDLGGLLGVIENPDPLRDRTLLAFDKNRIDGLDLASGATKLRKVGGPLAAWKLYGNPAIDPSAVSLTEVERILNLLTERRTVKSFPPQNEANFGPGAVTVKVWADGFEAPPEPKKDEKSAAKPEPKEKGPPVTLVFGKKEGDAIHVKRVAADGKTTDYFLVPEKIKVGANPEPVDLLAAVTKSRLDLLDKDLKGFSATNAAKLVAQGAVAFDLDRAESGGPFGVAEWKFAADAKGPAGQAYKKGETADAATVQGMLDILATTAAATRFVDEAPTAEKLEEYGLGKNLRLRVTVGLKGGFEPDDKERVYEFGKETTADPSLVYARQKGRQAVFTLPKFIPDKFTGADLRNKSIFNVNQADVSKVEITGWGSFTGVPANLVIEKNKEGVWVATKAPAGFTADPNKVRAFLNAISGLQVKAFTADNAMEARHGLLDDKQVFVVTLFDASGKHPLLYLRLGGPTEPNGTALYAQTSRVADWKPIVTVDAAALKAYRDAPASLAR